MPSLGRHALALQPGGNEMTSEKLSTVALKATLIGPFMEGIRMFAWVKEPGWGLINKVEYAGEIVRIPIKPSAIAVVGAVAYWLKKQEFDSLHELRWAGDLSTLEGAM